MAAHFDDKDDDLWELAELYVDLFPSRHRANPLTDLKSSFMHDFKIPVFCKPFGIYGSKFHRHEYSCLC